MGRAMGTVVLALLVVMAVQGPGYVSGEIDNVAFQWSHLLGQFLCNEFPALLTAGVQAQLHLAQWHSLLALRATGACTTEEAVVAYASFKIMAHYYPWVQSVDLYLGPLLDRQLRQMKASASQKHLAQRLGEAVAASVIQKRELGGQYTLGEEKEALKARSNQGPPAPGVFRYYDDETNPGGIDAAVFVFSVNPTFRPFVIPDPAAFVSQLFPAMKPPVIPSKEWDANWEALKDIGRLDWPGRTPEMNFISNLYACGRVHNNYCEQEPRAVAAAKSSLPNTTSLYDSVLLLAKMSVSMYDARICESTLKHSLWFWRPTQAYRDGDSKHAPIPDWTPYATTIPEPEYPSGAVTSVASGSRPLQNFFGKGKKVAFTIPGGGTFNCTGFEGDAIPTRHYPSLEAFVHEAQLSRMYAGAHFQKAVDDAYMLGNVVADYVEKHWTETMPSGVLPDQTFLDLVYTIPLKSGDFTPVRYDLPA